MQQYKISEENYKKFKKRWRTGMIITAAIVIVIFILNSLVSKDNSGNTYLYILPFFLAYVVFNIYRSLRKQERMAMSYTLTVSDNDITREQLNTPPLSINFMEIKEIGKTKKGGFIIKGRTRTDVINVPYMIDDPARLEEQLKKFAPITENPKQTMLWIRFALALVALACFMTLATTTNKILVIATGVVAAVLIILHIVNVQTSKNVPINMKRRSWTYLLALVLIIYMMYTKLSIGSI